MRKICTRDFDQPGSDQKVFQRPTIVWIQKRKIESKINTQVQIEETHALVGYSRKGDTKEKRAKAKAEARIGLGKLSDPTHSSELVQSGESGGDIYPLSG